MALEVATSRPSVSYEDIAKGLNQLHVKLQYRLSTKGPGSYASKHEILGIIEEEMSELKEAIREDGIEGSAHYQEELLDVAVGALFGYICMNGYIPI